MNGIKRIFLLGFLLMMVMVSSAQAAEEARPLDLTKDNDSFRAEDQMGNQIGVYYGSIRLTNYSKDFEQLAGTLTSYSSGESIRLHYGFEGYRAEAAEDISSRIGEGLELDGTWTFSRDIFLRRSDTVVVSFLERDMIHRGGPVPWGDVHSVFGRNIDSKTGKYLTLLSVFPSREALERVLIARLVQNYPYAEFARNPQELNVLFFLDKGEEELIAKRNGGTMEADVHNGTATWTLEPEGATFYFNPGTIAPMREGIYVVKIFADEIPMMFNPKYEHGAYGINCEYIPEEMEFIPKG